MQNKYKHITENYTAIACPITQNNDVVRGFKYKLAIVDRKTFEMLLQDRSSYWRAVYKDKKLQVCGTFNGTYTRLARIISNVEKDKNRSVYIATRDEFDFRRDNLVVDLRGKLKDRALYEKLEKIHSTLPKLPHIEIDEDGKPVLEKSESSGDNTTGKLINTPARFKITKTVSIESPNGKIQSFQVKNRDEEELITKVYDFVTSNLG